MVPSVLSRLWLNMGWGVFLVLVGLALLSVMGFSWSIGFALSLLFAVLLVWRFPFPALYLAFASLMLSGIIVPISTGTIQIGERAFGATIDVILGELVVTIVMFAWALRVFFAQEPEARDSARPWLPFGLGFFLVVLAQALSVFSMADPDPFIVLKYALRPVLFVYLAAVILPANFLRSWKRLKEACVALIAVGGFFALDGLRSLFFFGGDALGIYRAHPLSIFGMNALGGNHHALAELMVLVAPLVLALGERGQTLREKRGAIFLAAFFWSIALLTFARAAWLIVTLQVVLCAFFLWRDWIRKQRRKIGYAFLAFLPLAIYMIWFSLSAFVTQSTSARSMLLEVAWKLFRDHPWLGVGAGTFPERLSHVWAFAIEFGTSQDAHGMWQKIGAETGLFGLVAFVIVLISLGIMIRKSWKDVSRSDERNGFICFVVSAVGTLAYQLFSTSFWSPRVWISVGLLAAALRLLHAPSLRRDPNFLQ